MTRFPRRRPRAIPAFALLLAALLALPGCAGTKNAYNRMFHSDDPAVAEAPPCPETGLIPEAGELPLFPAALPKPQPADIVATGSIGIYRGACNFDTPGQEDFDLEVDFIGKKGPAGLAMGEKLKKIELPYFLAVLSKDDEILQRQQFSTTVDFDNKDQAASKEEHLIHIPLPSKEAAAGYKIVLGFRLTPEQLRYVNDHKQDKEADKKDPHAH